MMRLVITHRRSPVATCSKPQTSDVTDRRAAAPIDARARCRGHESYCPLAPTVPSIATNAELLSQIKIFDGLSDNALATAGGVRHAQYRQSGRRDRHVLELRQRADRGQLRRVGAALRALRRRRQRQPDAAHRSSVPDRLDSGRRALQRRSAASSTCR